MLLLFSHWVMSGCLWPHGQQHARLPCPSPSPEVYSDSRLCCPLLFLPSIFPSIRVFSNESALSSGGQSAGASASASVSPMHIQGRFPLGLDWFDLPVVQGTLKSLHYNLKASVLWCLTFFIFLSKLLSHVWIFSTPWTVAHQAPLSMEFSWQEYWSG